MLLHDVRTPAGDAARHEDRRVLRHGDTHDEIGHAAREVDVRVDALVAQHDRLHFVAHVEPFLARRALLLGELETPAAQDARAVVAVLVDAVAEAHQLALLREGALHPRVDRDLAACAVAVDVLEHLHRHLVGAAVERALERADAAADRAVHVGLGRGDRAAREGRRVEVVLRVEDERHVEDLRGEFVGLLAAHHPEEVRRVVERRVGGDRRLAVERHLARSDDRRDLREQALRLSQPCSGRIVLAVGVEVREERHA